MELNNVIHCPYMLLDEKRMNAIYNFKYSDRTVSRDRSIDP